MRLLFWPNILLIIVQLWIIGSISYYSIISLTTRPNMSRFLDEVRETIRRRGLVDSTEKTYTSWIKRYVLFHHYKSRDEIARAPRNDIERFLNHLANELKLSASSVNQALGALIFLYKKRCCIPICPIWTSRGRKRSRRYSIRSTISKSVHCLHTCTVRITSFVKKMRNTKS